MGLKCKIMFAFHAACFAEHTAECIKVAWRIFSNRLPGHTLPYLWFSSLGWGQIICISNNFSSDLNAAGHTSKNHWSMQSIPYICITSFPTFLLSFTEKEPNSHFSPTALASVSLICGGNIYIYFVYIYIFYTYMYMCVYVCIYTHTHTHTWL